MLIADANPIFKLHMFLGMTIFLVFPFTRLVHIWSAPVWYLGRRGYQIVRTTRPARPLGAASPATTARAITQARRPAAGIHSSPAE